MPTYRAHAIVLRTVKLGEADRIVTMLSRDHGKIRAVAKGVRRTGSKIGARLEPFTVVDVQCYQGRTLDTVTQVETLAAHGGAIVADYGKYTAAAAMVEAADRLTHDDGSAEQFALLAGGLRVLAAGEHDSGSVLDSYLLRAVAIAGWAPSLDACAVTGEPGPHHAFAIPLGGLVSDAIAPPGVARLDDATRELLIALAAGDWPVIDAADDRARGAASGLIAAYTHFHLERTLRSLRLVERADPADAGSRPANDHPTKV